MKKLKTLLLIPLLCACFPSCTKYFLEPQMLTYKVAGYNTSFDYYANADHQKHTQILNGEWEYSEPVQSGDSISILMFVGLTQKYEYVQIYFGTQMIFEGSPDSTGVVSITQKIAKDWFRLK